MNLVNLFFRRLVRGRFKRFVNRNWLRHAVGLAIILWAASGCTKTTETPRQDPAEFESAALMALVANLLPQAHWIDGEDRFWMKQEASDGARFVVVDAATGNQAPAFDHVRLAASLAEAGLADADAGNLPIVSLGLGGEGLVVTTAGGTFACAADATQCTGDETPPPSPAERPSPDGTRAAFVRDSNLWLRDLASGEETQLTSDGEEGFAYGNLGFELARVERRRSGDLAPITSVNWSPNGRYLATMRVDLRAVPLRAYITEHLPPDLPFTAVHLDRVPFPGEGIVPPREISVIDTGTGRLVRAVNRTGESRQPLFSQVQVTPSPVPCRRS